MRTFNQYLAIVEHLIEWRKMSIEDALAEAQVPLHYMDQVRAYILGPVEITPPDLLVSPQSVPMCSVDDNAPQLYTDAFHDFLLNERKWDRSVVETLAETSRDLVERLPLPFSSPHFQTRGLVVGYIQSGKTASMAALIARAADQGYKLFIVFAGGMKDLRMQTQRRLDQELVGHSDEPELDGPYVEHPPGIPRWVRLTRSGLEGEFRPGTHNDLNPQTPKLAAIKKNTTVLRRFTEWLQKSPVPLGDLPALVIDDEADQASIDTNYGKVDEFGEEVDPTKTNQAIRDLLRILPRCVYVGYTATPFANVLIDVTVEQDLFPRDFIASLPEPPGYLGPRQLFGLGMSPTDLSGEAPESPALDAIRHLSPEELDELDGLRVGGPCPKVLTRALWTFLLSSCARLARGQDRNHFTMLVHPSQSIADHAVFCAALSEEIAFIREVITRPRSFPNEIAMARQLWEDDFVKTTRALGDPSLAVQDFSTIWAFSRLVAEAIELKMLNFQSDDELDYRGTPKRYVAVGGNRLSRGLTLEGLSVSVFTRGASTYDTLLQMGRWFGFRPGYRDLTRIFVEPAMASNFADLARVELELRADLKKYARQPNPPTPAELAPRIRVHPTMAVTSRLKMGAAKQIAISFERTTQNTVNFPVKDRQALRSNQDTARAFVSGLGHPDMQSPMHIWMNVPASRVLEFLSSYRYGLGAQTVNRGLLTNYISHQNFRGELTLWDIVIPRGNPDREVFRWSDEVFSRKVVRTPSTESSIGVLQNPGDIRDWRARTGRSEEDATRGCLLLYVIDKDSGDRLKFDFQGGQGEDIVGFVLVFPRSNSGIVVGAYLSQHPQ